MNHTKPYTPEQLEGMIRSTLSKRIFVHMVDETTKKRILTKDPEIERRISEEVIYLNELQISCLTGTLLFEFDTHHDNNFTACMAMAVHLRSLECIR